MRWTRLAAVIALIAALAGGALLLRRWSEPATVDAAFRDLGYRPFAGRLSGSAWAPYRAPAVTRSPTRDGRLALASAALRLRGAATENTRAVGSLLGGDARDAVQRLRVLAARQPSPSAFNDLAVAHHALAAGDVEGLCEALAATERAVDLDPRLSEARFNRAVILESLSLSEAAADAYEEFLAIDGTTAWAAEARERLGRIRARPTQRQAWRENLPSLRRAAAAHDSSTIASAVDNAPQDARTWSEGVFLAEWADAHAAGDEAAAAIALALPREIGHALDRRGESLLLDAVSAIDRAFETDDRARLAKLQRAHALYFKSRVQYQARDVAQALAGLREASRLFADGGSPMALVAEYYAANAAIDLGDTAAALRSSLTIVDRAAPRHRSLRALNEWLRAALYGIDGLHEDMLRAYARAHAGFAALGEQQNASNMLDLMAATYSILGRTDEAWRLRRDTFRIAGASGIPQRLELALFGAATDAARAERWDVAHALLGLATGVENGNPRVQAEAAAWRALAAKRGSLRRDIEDELSAARRAASRIADGTMRGDAEGEVLLIEALLFSEDAERAVLLLTRYLAHIEGRSASHRMPRVLEERAALLRTLGRPIEARADLERAIGLIEQQRAGIAKEELRDSFLGLAGGAYEQLADLLDATGDAAGALATGDRRRARTILDRTAGGDARLDITRMQRIPQETAVLAYGHYESRLVIYACTSKGIDRYEVPASRRDVAELASTFTSAIARGAQTTARRAAKQLGDLLVTPAAATVSGARSLVFVLGGDLGSIPVAALMAEDGSFLVERYAVSVTPSLTAYLRPAAAPTDPPRRVVAVGNPALDAQRFPTLPILAGAEDEARHVASLYTNAVLLTGADATEAALRDALAHADVVDMAAHAVLDPRDSRNSRLLVADDDRHDGALTTSEIAEMRLRTRVVVLAGCRTAISGAGYGDVRNLAAAFLAAGARSVVASLWDVDDATTRDLSIAFHRALRGGAAPTDALREAQLRLLRSAVPRSREPRVWAALQVYSASY